ncbi:invasion associated locus B family protein [Aurantimonas aggregata]|uniref:Invasion associated locus B family protein n=1 Tax=Aurantimonas aggregata TaxID=2047720 RepID=A0A6L9MKP3_9HYPH|nr:invasion associated locus B family protein [Aurantimonas aggregata]NDV88196.1 invasion associated locus B family protein [Aurantimonas aggregata]
MLAAALVGLATFGFSVSGASAQGAPAGQPAAQPSGEPVPAEWFKVCSNQGENEICNTQYTMVADTRQLITAVNLINVKGAVNQQVIQAVVPTGRVIPAGVQLKIDTNAPVTLNYSVCFPDRCIAEAELTDALVASMKAGGQLTVTSINFQRQANPIPITLSGFTGAYDGPPTAQPELAQRQQELNEALQKQAEERRKKFEDAQNAAKAAPETPAQ